MYAPKHAAPKYSPRHAAPKDHVLVRGAAAVVVTSAALGTLILPAAAAQAATITAPHGPDLATCQAFMRSHGQPGRPGYRAMVRDARHADTYLRVDVGLLARHYSGTNARYVYLDCTTTGD